MERFSVFGINNKNTMIADKYKGRVREFVDSAIELCESFEKHYQSIHIKNQFYRASTSVGANFRAACIAQSRAAFISKLSISIEELDECEYWLELAVDNNYTEEIKAIEVKNEAHELASIFIMTRYSLRNNAKKP